MYTVLVLILLLGAGAGGFYVGARSSQGSNIHVTISSTTSLPSNSAGHLNVLATFFPVYDMAVGVLGNKGNVTLLVPETVDVHDFEPTPSAIQQVATADILIYSGAGLEPWIPQIVVAADNPKLVLVDSSAGLSLISVPTQFQKDNRTIDPHFWNDPILAEMQVNNIAEGLSKADPAGAQYFGENARAYNARLAYIDQKLKTGLLNVGTRTFVSFHLAFAYLAKEYNLVQVPIAGPFEESPTPQDISNAVNAANQNNLCIVFAESLENPAVAQGIASQTHAHVWILDPIEGLSLSDHNAGKTYLVKMQENVDVLLQALNQVGC